MKLILIILLILSSNCFGQKDTLIVGGGMILSERPSIHFDTVKVMMFYADTAAFMAITNNGERGIYNNLIRWQYGYTITASVGIRFVERSYLNIDKHPLPKSIVVLPELTRRIK